MNEPGKEGSQTPFKIQLNLDVLAGSYLIALQAYWTCLRLELSEASMRIKMLMIIMRLFTGLIQRKIDEWQEMTRLRRQSNGISPMWPEMPLNSLTSSF